MLAVASLRIDLCLGPAVHCRAAARASVEAESAFRHCPVGHHCLDDHPHCRAAVASHQEAWVAAALPALAGDEARSADAGDAAAAAGASSNSRGETKADRDSTDPSNRRC